MSGRWTRDESRLGVALVMLLGLSTALAVGPDDGSKDTQTPADKDKTQIGVRQPQIHDTPLQVSVDMVIVNVTVTDPYDRIVTGLEQDNFEVFDDKVAQKIVSFSTEDAPISVGLIFDCFDFSSDKILDSKLAFIQFAKTSWLEADVMLTHVNECLKLSTTYAAK